MGVLQLVHNQRTRPERAQDRSHSRRDRAETDAHQRLGQRVGGSAPTHTRQFATCMEHYLTWTNMTYGRPSGISRLLHACILSQSGYISGKPMASSVPWRCCSLRRGLRPELCSGVTAQCRRLGCCAASRAGPDSRCYGTASSGLEAGCCAAGFALRMSHVTSEVPRVLQ